MAQFPRTEPEIVDLAEQLVGGLRSHVEEFPSPPVSLERLEATLHAYQSARFSAQEAAVQAKLATREKAEVLERLVSEVKTNLRYAENSCGHHHATLKMLGWGGRRPKKRTEAPGQVVGLKIVREGPGWIELRWRKPGDGGDVKAYRIERCKRGDDFWRIAGMSTGTSAMLEDQERGVDWIYRVIAVNSAGEGQESAIVEAVL